MQVSLTNPPEIFTIQKVNFPYPHWIINQVKGRAGDLGKLRPHANLAIPSKRETDRLKPAVAYAETLPKTETFNYGTSSSFRKKPEPPLFRGKPPEFNRINDLPLFKKH
jgi:hypothetical protein